MRIDAVRRSTEERQLAHHGVRENSPKKMMPQLSLEGLRVKCRKRINDLTDGRNLKM